jgi:hypothetical protein
MRHSLTHTYTEREKKKRESYIEAHRHAKRQTDRYTHI